MWLGVMLGGMAASVAVASAAPVNRQAMVNRGDLRPTAQSDARQAVQSSARTDGDRTGLAVRSAYRSAVDRAVFLAPRANTGVSNQVLASIAHNNIPGISANHGLPTGSTLQIRCPPAGCGTGSRGSTLIVELFVPTSQMNRRDETRLATQLTNFSQSMLSGAGTNQSVIGTVFGQTRPTEGAAGSAILNGRDTITGSTSLSATQMQWSATSGAAAESLVSRPSVSDRRSEAVLRAHSVRAPGNERGLWLITPVVVGGATLLTHGVTLGRVGGDN